MPFNSLKYFLFLPVVYLVFYFAGDRARWIVLLAASLLFYAALNVPYLLVVLALVAMTTYGFGIWLDQAESAQAKRALLWGGVAANVLILIVMKYLPFLSENLKALSSLLSLDAQIQPVKAFVAIGVSYYVFQAISYLFDIYLEIEKPERHFGYFALYLGFFPKLLQGPIERAGDLLPQLREKYEFNYDNMRFGLLLFTWGLFKKVVIADRLGLYVDTVYNDVHAFTGLPLLLATYAYAFQIYMDFSGYTDMALGSARLFNINLTQNFNSPYLATSVADFWRRWHITFSRWILDYIFKPLQMQWRNWKNWGTAMALVVAFLVSGIWHGASWGFVIWGGLHGLYMACSVFYKPYQKKLHAALGLEKTRVLKYWQIFVTFNLVSFAWIFFRAANLKDALYVISNLFSGMKGLPSDMLSFQVQFELFVLMLVAVVYLLVNRAMHKDISELNSCTRWSIYLTVFNCILYFGVTNSGKFIYVQF
jgi:D-alanyl-lipoteichoic acid acyltransferase DltB (MBOAT superfamily)